MRKARLDEKFYSKLLRLYPRDFRERFGSEMRQNFRDLSRETETVHRFKWLRVAWLFGDAIVQAGRENLEQLRSEAAMKKLVTNARLAAIVGTLTLLPGAVMMTLLFLGIEPPLGPLGDLLRAQPDGSTMLGISTAVVLGVVVVLPFLGVLAVAALRKQKAAVSDIGLAAGIGLLVVAPMMLLQTTVGRASYSSFPLFLFGLIWLLTTVFAAVAAPSVRAIRSGEGVLAHPGLLATKVLFLILIAVFWMGLVVDQMPCFVGVPNCD